MGSMAPNMYGIRIDGIRNAGMQEKENLILESFPPFMPSSSRMSVLHRDIIIPFHPVPPFMPSSSRMKVPASAS
jgi:hypothetical protein